MKGKSAFEASSMLQGPSETFVDITVSQGQVHTTSINQSCLMSVHANNAWSTICQVKHGNCGSVQSIKVQRQSIAKSPVFYRLEQVKSSPSSAGYVRLKEFNALARKDLVTGRHSRNTILCSFKTYACVKYEWLCTIISTNANIWFVI